ncbi:MAG: hypothetical protein IJG65_00105 [Synergistaceae bacterium]|nr:hypothetical protein [Synergistaceae bacterium]
MRHPAIEKRADAVIRWLERLKKSYSSGAVESALMDAECARADIEALRLDVSAVLRPGNDEGGHKFLPRLVNAAKVAFLAVAVVLFAVFPVSRDIPAELPAHELDAPVLAEPIEVVREAPAMNQDTRARKPKKPSAPQKRSVQASVPASEKTSPKPKPKPEPERGKTVAYDKVFSLIQTGQKALKNNSSVIKIK